MKLFNKKVDAVWIYLFVYFFISLFFLTRYPYMHSDESWLSGLSLSIMNGGYDSTEYFFDLYPRNPHAIKIIFQSLQILFINVFGYSLFAVRLMSLLFGMAGLIVFYKICVELLQNKTMALIGMMILSVDIQFVYASHFARQEIIILFVLMLGFYYLYTCIEKWSHKNDYILGTIIGLSVGIHPNSFIVAMTFGCMYLYYMSQKKLKIMNVIRLILTVTVYALVFVGISFLLDPHFIHNYLSYGDTMGVNRTGLTKFLYVDDFYKLIFKRDSVTYYMPPIQFQFIMFGIISFVSLLTGYFKRTNWLLLSALFAINFSIVFIGRYSQPGIVLIFPFMYLLIFNHLKHLKWHMFVLLFVVILGISGYEVLRVSNDTYDHYLNEIEEVIPDDAIVLGNLNVEYVLSYGQFYDYRNLGFLDVNIVDYIEERNINYIIYPEEMDFIYDRRPTWNFLYGNTFPYYDDLQAFFESDCELIYEFENPYGMRIVRLHEQENWSIKIYQVK